MKIPYLLQMQIPQIDVIKCRAFETDIQNLSGFFKIYNEETLKFLTDTEDLNGCSTFKSGLFIRSRVEAEVSLLLQQCESNFSAAEACS